MLKNIVLFIAIIGFATVSFSGCGGGGDRFDRVPFAGTVSLNGDTNQSGSITGTVDSASTVSEGTEVPTVHAAVIDGKFEFTPESRPAVGAYVFEINLVVPDENSDPVNPEYANEVGGNTVQYTKLVNVPEGGSEEFAIELTDADKGGEGAVPASGEI